MAYFINSWQCLFTPLTENRHTQTVVNKNKGSNADNTMSPLSARIIITALLLLLSTSAHAATNSLSGGSGLMVMRTAEIANKSTIELSMSDSLDIFREPGGDGHASDIVTVPNVNYGVSDNLEIGLGTPVLYNLDDSAVGLRFFRAIAKFRFINRPGEGVGIAATSYGTVVASNDDSIASGDRNYGLELNISLTELFNPVINLHITLAYEKADIRKAAPNDVYRREENMRLDMGIDTAVSATMALSLEILYSQAGSNDDNLLLLPGLRYSPFNKLSILFGAGFGLPKDRSQPQYRLVTGLSYLLTI